MKNTLFLIIVSLFIFSACAGYRETNRTFSAHAESFRIIGIPIPHDDQLAAESLVPKGAKVTTVKSSPADWTSLLGFVNNLFGFSQTTISGLK